MPRFCTVIGVLLIAALLVAPMFDATAAIKVKRTARSWNELAGTTTSKGPWNIQNGLRAVGVGSRSYFKADTTGSGAVGTPAWTLTSKPGGSTVAAFDSVDGKWINSFRPDVVGQYIVSATVGGQTASDTIYASTYSGVGTDAYAGCFCHMAATASTPSTANAIKTAWSTTIHANGMKLGLTGYLEVERGKGAFAASCIKCHTTGWDTTAAAAGNGNFGRLAKASGWDTTWYKGLEFMSGDYWTTTGDTTAWNLLSAPQKTLANVGCESCHGPATDHKTSGDKLKIGRSLDPGVCNQCHDGSSKHSIGTYFRTSNHAEGEIATPAEGGRSNCQPCHTGKGFIYYMDHNQDTTGIAAAWNLNTDPGPITCVACHDPHGNSNPGMIRTMRLKGDSLRNGYRVPAAHQSNSGNLCGNCHNARYDVRARVNPSKSPYYGFTSRYGPHYSGQMDMLMGTSGYQFGDSTLTGAGTHQGLEGGCVTCHMQERPAHDPSVTTTMNNLSHTFKFDTLNAASTGYKPTRVCSNCHGEIEEFNDIKAAYDYDRNGKIEGVQTEVQGMLDKLKATLPKDTLGNVIGSGTLSHSDSVAVNGKLNVVAGIWNYYFVSNDRSLGVHNTKYAVGLLYRSLGWTPLSVKQIDGFPKEYALNQNYPNPFNPSTTIRFSIPQETKVKLVVYDMTGAVVKTILNDALSAGNKEATWDGTNSNGAKVATGMYIYRLEAGNFTATKKMLLLK
jgi:hypothetical protein